MTSPAGSSAVIQAKAVQKTFKRGNDVVHAVNDVSLSIAAGETVGLIGESGSGKTTLGRLMLGLLPPDEGEILFEGTSLGRRQRKSSGGCDPGCRWYSRSPTSRLTQDEGQCHHRRAARGTGHRPGG